MENNLDRMAFKFKVRRGRRGGELEGRGKGLVWIPAPHHGTSTADEWFALIILSRAGRLADNEHLSVKRPTPRHRPAAGPMQTAGLTRPNGLSQHREPPSAPAP